MNETGTLTFSQVVAAPATAVYYALTNQTALQQWLCANAQVDVRVGGRVYFYWQQGYYTAGEFTALEPNQKVAYTWHGRKEPAQSQVDITLTAENGHTTVHLTHTGVGSDEAWGETPAQLKLGWESSLANLQSVLEKGVDKRVTERPFMGILITGVVNADEAAQNNWPVKGGIRLSGAAPDSGAAAAGLQNGDVLIGIGGNEVFDFPTLQAAIGAYKIGDSIAIAFYRGEDKINATLILSGRPMTRVPDTPQAFSEALNQVYAQVNGELDSLFAEATEAEADFRPDPEAWNAKEILAHLILTERVVQTYICTEITDGAPGGFPNNPNSWGKAVTAVYPTVAAVVQAWKNAQAETVALLANLPESYVARQITYHNTGGGFFQWTEGHIRDHYGEIRTVLEAARSNKS